MATTETKVLDQIITSRRALLAGGSALAALVAPGIASAAVTLGAANVTDANILNFALNLEYLEANYYWLAAFGTTIDKGNAASMAAAGVTTSNSLGISGLAYQGLATPPTAVSAGVVPTTTGAGAVPFTLPAIKSYAVETALEEGKHVTFLRNALGTAGAIAQPQIDLSVAGAWATIATAAGVPAAFLPFNPYANDVTFLIGAYVFEDVGVSAYHGAASLLTSKTNLSAAGGILAVEAYHAGLVRTSINALDPTGSLGYVGLTQAISKLRATLAFQAVATPNPNSPYDPNPDDYGLSGGMTTYSLAGTSVLGTQIVDADPTNVIAFSRTTNQVLNIVTGGGALTAGSAAKGVFFPAGLNGVIA